MPARLVEFNNNPASIVRFVAEKKKPFDFRSAVNSLELHPTGRSIPALLVKAVWGCDGGVGAELPAVSGAAVNADGTEAAMFDGDSIARIGNSG